MTPSTPPALPVPDACAPLPGAENVLAASLFDMPDLAQPLLELGGWLLAALVPGLLVARGLSRLRRRRPPRG